MTPQIAREGHQNERKVDIFAYKGNALLNALAGVDQVCSRKFLNEALQIFRMVDVEQPGFPVITKHECIPQPDTQQFQPPFNR